jgi:hypothetical protein
LKDSETRQTALQNLESPKKGSSDSNEEKIEKKKKKETPHSSKIGWWSSLKN